MMMVMLMMMISWLKNYGEDGVDDTYQEEQMTWAMVPL